MGLTFSQQLFTVGAMAFTSGLLLGIAFFRGEIGALGGFSPPAHQAARRRRPPPRLVDLRRQAIEGLRNTDPALMWVLIALAILIAASGLITRLSA